MPDEYFSTNHNSLSEQHMHFSAMASTQHTMAYVRRMCSIEVTKNLLSVSVLRFMHGLQFVFRCLERCGPPHEVRPIGVILQATTKRVVICCIPPFHNDAGHFYNEFIHSFTNPVHLTTRLRRCCSLCLICQHLAWKIAVTLMPLKVTQTKGLIKSCEQMACLSWGPNPQPSTY